MKQNSLSDLEQQGIKTLYSAASAAHEKLRGGFFYTYSNFFKPNENKIKIDPSVAIILARIAR